MTTAELYHLYLEHPFVQTDTRKLKAGDLFFALRGANYNGNDFAKAALDRGAVYAIIDEAEYAADDRMILVKDVLATLQQLARYHRDQFHIPFIAITGSNGKTTTKELVKAVLSTTYKTGATEGNLNNHIGIPLTVLGIREETQMAVIEMGANHQKEIEGYCKIVHPTHGLITNVGKAHLEGFGGIEGVRKGKGELFDHLRKQGGTAFACSDFDYFKEMAEGIREVVWYGTKGDADVNGEIKTAEPFLSVQTDYAGLIPTRLAGNYNSYNVLAAVAVGKYFKVPPGNIKMAIENYTPSNNRSQFIRQGSNSIIMDAYNANPSSMRAAIENFVHLHAGKKILMLGAMMELGSESLAEHRDLVSFIEKYPWEKVVLVGGDFEKIKHPFVYLPDAIAAKEWLQQQHFEQAALLIKGSRSISMEKILS